MKQSHSGKCVGGPWDGQMLAAPTATKVLFENSALGVKRIGEYRLNDFGQWHWWPTDVGRALTDLKQALDKS